MAIDADVFPDGKSPAKSHKKIENAFRDAIRDLGTWEDELLQKPQRTFRNTQYVTSVVPDPVTRELLLATHWEFRAHNEPADNPLPVTKLADRLSAAHDELVGAGYPYWGGRSFTDVEDELSWFTKQVTHALPHRDRSDLELLDRSPQRMYDELEQAINALWEAGGRAQEFVTSHILNLMSQRLAAHRAREDAEGGGDELARYADETASVEDAALEGDEWAAVEEAVQHHRDNGGDLIEAARAVFRGRYGWAEGTRRVEQIKELLCELADEPAATRRDSRLDDW